MAESSVQNQSQPRRGAAHNHGRRRPHGRGGGKGGARPSKNAVSSTPTSSSSAPNANKAQVDSGPNDAENANPAAQTPQTGAEDNGNDNDDDDAGREQDLCWICAEPIKYYAVSECNHRTCHVCALRLRALYKKLDCTFCKVRVASASPSSPRVQWTFDRRAQGTTTHSRLHRLARRPLLVLRPGERPVRG